MNLRFSFRTAAILIAVAGGAITVAVLSRGWDRLVLTEAPKSIKYRFEYWQATAAMISEHPWLGVGPGNFQDWYPRYKLPQASETIADPHNAWLEMAATAGLPALLLLVGWQAALVLRLVRGRTLAGGNQTLDASATSAAPIVASSRFAIYAGLGLGLFLVLPLDLLVTFMPEGVEPLGGLPVAWLLGGPVAALTLYGLDSWVIRGELPSSLLVVGLATLAVNLLAAGSLMFPGVMTTCWVLAAIATTDNLPDRREGKGNLALRWTVLAGGVALAFLAHQTLYDPVLASQTSQYEISEARTRGEFARAQAALRQWIAADPWSAEPWRNLAEIEWEVWLASDEKEPPAAFVEAVAQCEALSPNSPRQPDQVAQWYWTAWRRGKDRKCRDSALQLWHGAVQRYPNGSYLRAQFAWALAEAGQSEEARNQAKIALHLDSQNPHREQKLANRRLFDPLPGADSPYRVETAEASLRQIAAP